MPRTSVRAKTMMYAHVVQQIQISLQSNKPEYCNSVYLDEGNSLENDSTKSNKVE